MNENKIYIRDNVEKHDSPETERVNKSLALGTLDTSLEHTRANLDWKKIKETKVKTNSEERSVQIDRDLEIESLDKLNQL